MHKIALYIAAFFAFSVPVNAQSLGGTTLGMSGSGSSKQLRVLDAPGGNYVPFANVDSVGHAIQAAPSFVAGVPADPMTISPVTGNARGVQARDLDMVLVTDFPGVDKTGATDSTTGFNEALAAVAAYHNACLWVPDGLYVISSQLTVSLNQTCLRGASRYTAHIVSTSTTADVLHVNDGVVQYRIDGLYLGRNGGVVPTAGAGLYVGNQTVGHISNVEADNNFDNFHLGSTANSTCENCYAYYGYRHGFFLSALDSYPYIQWEMVNTDSENNNGWGYIAATAPTKDTLFATWQHPRSFGNGIGGLGFSGLNSGSVSDLFLRDVLGSTDNYDEINISNVGNNIKINGCILELAGTGVSGRSGGIAASLAGGGIDLYSGSGVGIVQISDCLTQHNSQQGLNVAADIGGVSVSNFQSLANTQHANGPGIVVSSTTTPVSFSNVTSFNDTGTAQTYGLSVVNASNIVNVGSRYSGLSGGCAKTTGTFTSAAVVGSGC